MFDKRPIFSQSSVSLKNQAPFTKGGRRACYIHPDNPALCIKISNLNAMRARMRDKSFLYRHLLPLSRVDDNVEEAKGYQQKAIWMGGARIWDHIPRLHGWQETDIGTGLVLDYYQLADGQPVKTLQTILRTDGLTHEIENALQSFSDYMFETMLMSRALLPHNIVLADDGRLKLIDGIGGRTLIPIDTSKIVARQHIKRHVNRLYQRVKRESIK